MDTIFLGNPVKNWLFALLLAGATWAALGFLKRAGLSRLEALAGKTHTSIDDAVAGALTATKWWFYLWLSVFVGAYALTIDERHSDVLEGIATVTLLAQAAVWLLAGIGTWLDAYSTQKEAEEGETFRLKGTVMFLFRLVIWVVFALLLLENVGVDVSALVAGLGVGGIAVALAVQNVLGDLLASLSIAVDQPFVPGDFIVVGDLQGTVLATGLKTTRVKSISGEQLVFSNTDLLQARIRNYGRMDERRIAFDLGFEYDTPKEQLEAIPAMVRAAVEAREHARFDRCHFKAFGDSALLFETVYFMTQPDYGVYMDTQQDINLQLAEAFRERGIGFAYPSQTLYVHNVGSGPARE